jgi:hypothetical protein
MRYALPVAKVIREILVLLWKVFRKVLWKWLKPILARVVLIGLLIVAVITVAIVLLGR